MDSSRFDELTKALATSTSRRQALQRIGGTLAGSLLAAWPLTQTLAAGGGNSTCAHFCASVFGADTPAAKQCTSDAAHGQGLCYTCGPAAPAAHPPLCGQVCCGNGQSCCRGTCTDLNTTSNCGSCGKVCTTTVANATATCTNGVCGFVCNSGYKTCNGTCISNNGCCGGCPSGQVCQNGACVTPTYLFICYCNDDSAQHTCSTDTCNGSNITTVCKSLCASHGGYAFEVSCSTCQ